MSIGIEDPALLATEQSDRRMSGRATGFRDDAVKWERIPTFAAGHPLPGDLSCDRWRTRRDLIRLSWSEARVRAASFAEA